MRRTRRRFDRDFKLRLLTQLRSGKTVAQLSREHDLSPNLLYLWQRQLEKYGERAFAGNGNAYTDEARIAELERKVGQLTLENDFLQRANRLLLNAEAEEKKRGGRR